jgi:hypothetical protein
MYALLWVLSSCEPTEPRASLAPPPNVFLEQDPLVPGQPAHFRVRGAQPGDRVWFARSTSGPGPGICPPRLGVCLGIVQAQLIGSTTANQAGVADLRVVLPANLPPLVVYTQALVDSGAGAVATNIVTASIVQDGTDDDGDGYCEGSVCQDPAVMPGDCDDASSTTHPGAVEVCNGLDDDCAGRADDDGAVGCAPYHQDRDGDGYGAGPSVCACGPRGSWTARNSSDCYDDAALVSPGQRAYFSQDRGDGSFDYDCSGSEDPQNPDEPAQCEGTLRLPFPLPALACDFEAGWEVVAPSCGQTGTWVSSCAYTSPGLISACADLDALAADQVTTEQRVQRCR